MLHETEQLVGDINRFQAYLCTIHNQAQRVCSRGWDVWKPAL